MAAMHQGAEQMPSRATDKGSAASGAKQQNSRWQIRREIRSSESRLMDSDKAAHAVAVMLHLRSCYVSKAAILTVPVQPVPAENRSPA